MGSLKEIKILKDGCWYVLYTRDSEWLFKYNVKYSDRERIGRYYSLDIISGYRSSGDYGVLCYKNECLKISKAKKN